jgi:hypothetical protein
VIISEQSVNTHIIRLGIGELEFGPPILPFGCALNSGQETESNSKPPPPALFFWKDNSERQPSVLGWNRAYRSTFYPETWRSTHPISPQPGADRRRQGEPCLPSSPYPLPRPHLLLPGVLVGFGIAFQLNSKGQFCASKHSVSYFAKGSPCHNLSKVKHEKSVFWGTGH